MAKWQGTVVPNSGYVEKVYFNNKLSADEVYNILSQLTYIETPFLTYPVYPILFTNDGNPVMFVTKYIGSVSNLTYYDIFLSTDITNPETAVTILNMDSSNDILIVEFNNTEYTINKEVINDYSGLPIGIQNDLISSLVSSTPFTQSTTADKLQKLIDGKQYVVDKTNAKAETSLNIKSKWKDIGDVIEGIKSGGSALIKGDWQGTVVPNSGYVEKVYFNTNLSVEEVVNCIENANLTYDEDGFIFLLQGETPNNIICVVNNSGVYGIANFVTQILYFTSADVGAGFVGWNPEFNGVINIEENLDALPTTENDKLTSLFSTTPFVQSTLTLEGEYDGSTLTITELPSGEGTVVPNTGAIDIKSLIENDKRIPLQIKLEGIGGSGIVVPSVSNLQISDKGVASWDEPDFTELEGFDYTYIYIVKVNDKETETTDTTKNIAANLKEGTNIVSVVVKVTVTTIKNGKEISTNCEFSMPEYLVVTLDATLPVATNSMASALVGTNVYLFGGNNGSMTNLIYKFDTTNETITTLTTTLPSTNQQMTAAAVGTNIYIFGGFNSNKIYKFDTTTETIKTLSTKLPVKISSMGVTVVGTNVYLFGGLSSGSYVSTIYKFDSVNETITTLSTTLLVNTFSCALVGTNVYLFGGSYGKTDIQKFDTTTETIETLSTTLPKKIANTTMGVIDTNIYLFGGTGESGFKQNKIYKFDSTTETITTLDTTLPIATNGMTAAVVGTSVYLFGGDDGNNLDTILKFIE